jgi:hypothetical protein
MLLDTDCSNVILGQGDPAIGGAKEEYRFKQVAVLSLQQRPIARYRGRRRSSRAIFFFVPGDNSGTSRPAVGNQPAQPASQADTTAALAWSAIQNSTNPGLIEKGGNLGGSVDIARFGHDHTLASAADRHMLPINYRLEARVFVATGRSDATGSNR